MTIKKIRDKNVSFVDEEGHKHWAFDNRKISAFPTDFDFNRQFGPQERW
jgi:hypothetical protein